MSRSCRSRRERLRPPFLVAPTLVVIAAFATLNLASASAATSAVPNAPVPQVVGNVLETSSGQPLRLLGVDADGTDNACFMGGGFSWASDSATEAAEIAAWHTNAVRVPINEDCWLGINGVPAQYSGPAYQQAIEQWIGTLNAAGLVAIIDLDLTAPGSLEATSPWPMADEDHSPTVWQQIARAFVNNPSVIFDLFNEPFLGGASPTATAWQCWENGCETSFNSIEYQAAGMQQLVNVVRETGAAQPIMLAGLNFATDLCAPIAGQSSGSPCAWVAYKPSDPRNQLIASFHTYSWEACATLSCWNSQIAPVALKAPLVTGEFGESDCSAQFMNSYEAWADSHNVSYLAWAWQAPSPQEPMTCTPSPNSSNTNVNLILLANSSGAPSDRSPQGSAFQAHLAALALNPA